MGPPNARSIPRAAGATTSRGEGGRSRSIINAKCHWGRTDIQVAFTIFIATETWLVPVEGWFVDRFGPRIVVMVGGIVVALAWSLCQGGVGLRTGVPLTPTPV